MSDTTTNLTDPKPVTLDLAHLPDDPAFLKQLVIDLVSQLQQEKTEKEHLHHRLAQILRHRFGRRAETLDPHQMELFLQQVKDRLQQIPPPPPEPPLTPVPPSGHGRRKPPMNLPRRRVEYPLPAEKRFCSICGKPLVKIGEEVRHVYEYVPASIVVVEQVKEKWACEPCQGNVVESELPPIPIEKGMPGPGLLAHVITSKYADHLPLYRQESILARHGLSLTRSTMCDWIGRSSDLLSPLYAEMTKDLLGSHKLNTDDTPVPVLDDRKPKEEDPTSIITSGEAEAKADEGPARRKTREGRLWVYVGDDSHPHIVFDYSPDRRQEHPQRFLAGWHGSLQADAYTGYDPFAYLRDVIERICTLPQSRIRELLPAYWKPAPSPLKGTAPQS